MELFNSFKTLFLANPSNTPSLNSKERHFFKLGSKLNLFGMKEVLSIYLGMNFLREHEVFEERHLLSALGHMSRSLPEKHNGRVTLMARGNVVRISDFAPLAEDPRPTARHS